MNNRYLILIIILLSFSSCKQKEKDYSLIKEDDFLFQYIDSTVKPGDDFFSFATGSWMKNNPIPSSERRWGIGNLVRNDIYSQIRQINDESAGNKEAKKGSNTQRIGDFWFAGMDSITIDEQGIKPLQPQFDLIASIKSKEDLLKVIGEFQMYAGSPLFSPAIFQDEKNSNKMALHFYQGGIGLPERDYYINTDARTQNIRKEYKIHLIKMFSLLGDNEKLAKANSEIVFNIETDLARASRKLEDLNDPYANYNKMSLDEFTLLTPSIHWKTVLDQINLKNIDSVIVGQPEFYKQVEKSISTVSLDDWKTYLRWNLINEFAKDLSKPFDLQNFSFFGTVMSGTTTQRPRWKRIMDEEESFLGDALGQLYVEKYVPVAMRNRYKELTENMLITFKEHVSKLDWMSDSTKSKAEFKLSKVDRILW